MKRALPLVFSLMGVASTLSTPASLHAEAVPFLRGDANQDGVVSIADCLAIRRWLFSGLPSFPCFDAADVDDKTVVFTNGVELPPIVLTDMVHVLNAMLLGGKEIPAPFPEPGVDPTDDDGVTCDSYVVQPAEETGDVLRLGEAEAVAGETVDVPVYLTNSVPVEAFQLVLEYDLAAISVSRRLNFDGSYYERFRGNLDFDDEGGAEPLIAIVSIQNVVFPGEGRSVVGVMGHPFYEGYEIEPGDEKLICKIRLEVQPGAAPGTYPLTLSNGLEGQGSGPFRLRNELTYEGEARLATLVPGNLMPGRLQIVEDIAFFRGDANGDRGVDIADPIFTLSYLFQGGETPRCLDATDADDSGVIEITDAILVLETLFSTGERAISQPWPEEGFDPTQDGLARCRR